jgi:hypothetical protein
MAQPEVSIHKLEELRLIAPSTLSDMRENMRQELTTEAVRGAIADARSLRVIHKFNVDGSEVDADPQSIRADR